MLVQHHSASRKGKTSVEVTQADRQAQRPQSSTMVPGSVPFGEQRAAFLSRAGHACFLTPAGERRGNERLLTLPEKPWHRAKSVTGQNQKENRRRPVAKPHSGYGEAPCINPSRNKDAEPAEAGIKQQPRAHRLSLATPSLLETHPGAQEKSRPPEA